MAEGKSKETMHLKSFELGYQALTDAQSNAVEKRRFYLIPSLHLDCPRHNTPHHHYNGKGEIKSDHAFNMIATQACFCQKI